MQITNNHDRQPVALPNGQLIEPGDSVEFIGDWQATKAHPVVAHWLKTEQLTIEGDEPQPEKQGKAAPKLPELPKP